MASGAYQTSTSVESSAGRPSTGRYCENPVRRALPRHTRSAPPPSLPPPPPTPTPRPLSLSNRNKGPRARRPPRRPDAEEQPHRGAEDEGKQNGEGRDQRIPVGQLRQHDGAARAEYHADHTAQQAEHQRFDQELEQDVEPGGAERLADADLAGALGDRHQHDVHDSDAAHE